MNKALTLAVIGGGRIGRVHVGNILHFIPDVKVKTVADSWEGAGEWVRKLGIGFTTDIGSLFADDEIDAVLICSSTDTHVKYTVAAAEAGKHIFCEKPIDQDVANIHQAIAAVEKAGVKFQIGFNRRFDHNFRAMKKAVLDGVIGDVQFVNITSRDPGPPPLDYVKVSGGMFLDMTIHDFDMARFLAGSDVTEVYAKGAVMIDPEIGKAGDIDSAVVILQFANGAIGTINNSREAAYGYDQRAEVFGSKGSVEIKNEVASTAVISTKEGVISEKPLHFFMDRYTQAYVDEIKDFVAAVRNDTDVPATARDGLESVVIARAAAESMRTGMPVRL
jgi:myo-inositol 2-dehydrogenase/D-chiro-inositol 1-dehydrogenase